MNKWICYSPMNCKREDDAIRFTEEGLEVAVVLPTVTRSTITNGSIVQKDYFYPTYSKTVCSFGTRCTKKKCSYQHTHKPNLPRIFGNRITEVEAGCLAGFALGKKVRAIVCSLSKEEPVFTIEDIEIDIIWTEDELPEDIRYLATNLQKLYPSYNVPQLSYTWDDMGKLVPVQRDMTLKRFFTEYCVDGFSERASKLAGVVGQLVESEYTDIRKYFDARGQASVPVRLPSSESYICVFTHPLRDYACLINMISLYLKLGGRKEDSDYELLTTIKDASNLYSEQDHARRVKIMHYINLVDSGKPLKEVHAALTSIQ